MRIVVAHEGDTKNCAKYRVIGIRQPDGSLTASNVYGTIYVPKGARPEGVEVVS